MRDIKVSPRPRSSYAAECGFQDWPNGGRTHPTLPRMSNSHCATGARPFTHDALAQRTTERCGYGLLGTHLQRRILSGHRVQVVQMGGGRVRHLLQCQSGDVQAGQTNPSWVYPCPQAAKMDPRSTGRTSVTSASSWVFLMRG